MKTLQGFVSSSRVLPLLVFALTALQAPFPSRAATTLVGTADIWKYLDDGSDQGTAWREVLFDDGEWSPGPSPLGFGESYITTTTQTDLITAYFRHAFSLTSAAAVTNLRVQVRRDDGVAVYLNGTEIFRNNLSPAAGYDTLANISTEASFYLGVNINPSLLRNGLNVLAAEVHQGTVPSSDLVFDLRLFTDSDLNPVPQVHLVSPTNNAIVRRGSTVEIQASVIHHQAQYVNFFADSTLLGSDNAAPFQWSWTNAPLGSFLLRVIATASDSILTSQPVALTVVTNIAPSAAIISPSEGAILPAGVIEIQAAGLDPDGGVTVVEFFANGFKIGTDDLPPYSMLWRNLSPGSYFLRTRVTDTDGVSTDSENVSIQVIPPLGVIRGPYLQSATKNSIVVRWRTDASLDSQVRYGTAPLELNQTVTVPGPRTEHEVPLSGLAAGTKYYYSVGSSGSVLAGGSEHFFVTHPASPQPTRIWVIGDSGTASSQARAVFDEYREFTGSRYTDLWLMLGDNAYGSGTDTEYQNAVFAMYPELLRQTAVWPTIGNHDASPAYFDIFTLPQNGEVGGVPSGTEHYYSFNYGNIHFVNLGGYYSGSLLSNGPMWLWLEQDLAANTNDWLIAYWHQPPYTKGSHDSDSEGDLIAMRENFVPLLEAYGVDLVLGGHSHCYERSYLLHGHYGNSSTLTPSMILNGGSGRPEEGGAYLKGLDGPTANRGTVYVVAGSSGWATFGSMDHPVMHSSFLRMGSLVLDIDDGTLRGTFLRETGEIDDYFTIQKGSSEVRITDFALDEGTVTIGWNSVVGTKYQLEFATNLSGNHWQPVGPQITAQGPHAATGHVTPANVATGFYRVVTVR